MIKSYVKLVQILDFVKVNPDVNLQTIADGLSISKSTLHRIVMELVEYAFLSRDDKNLTYKLGSRFIEYHNTVIENIDIRTESSDIITKLNNETRETIHLAFLVDDRIVYVDKRESLYSIRMFSLIGKEAPVHCTGVGKVIAAFQPSNIIDRIVSKHELTEHTEHTITTYRDLKKEFEKIRNEGVAYDLEEHEVGIICIAAPIRNHISQVVGSISITSITQRMTSEQLGGMKDLLVDAADTVSQRLGFRKKSQI